MQKNKEAADSCWMFVGGLWVTALGLSLMLATGYRNVEPHSYCAPEQIVDGNISRSLNSNSKCSNSSESRKDGRGA